jgi:hypothetical protein
MSWLIAASIVIAGVAYFLAHAVTLQHNLSTEDVLTGFRVRNAALIQKRFRPAVPAAVGAWHRVLHHQESTIVYRGQGVVLGLREVLLLEDECARHWRVVVAHQNDRPPLFEVKELGPGVASSDEELRGTV